MISGYLLWLILPRLTTSEIIGTSSTVISLAMIFSTVVDLGVSGGSTRFLGKSFSQRTGDTKVLVNASLLITAASIIVSSIAILVFRDWIFPYVSFDLIVVSILLIDASVIYNILRSILIAMLETNSLPKVITLSSIWKIVLTVTLVLSGTGALGITVGYLSGYVLGAILLSFTLVTVLSPIKKAPIVRLFNACTNIVIASIPTLIPKVIGTLGTNLGTVLVFGMQGASEAGSYFIAFSIFYGIAAIRESLFSVGFPVLSAMDDQRKTLVSKLIKMSSVITLPICSIVFLYSDDIMALFGSQYIQSSLPLKIMSLSMLTSTFTSGISTLFYSYGNYWKVLVMGIVGNGSRILLYFILVPSYGDTGAALSLSLGSLIGFAASVVIAQRIGMLIFWQQLAILFFVPMGLVYVLGYFHVTPVMGVPIILALSLVVYYILRVLTKSDVRTSIDLLPDSIGKPLINLLNKL